MAKPPPFLPRPPSGDNKEHMERTLLTDTKTEQFAVVSCLPTMSSGYIVSVSSDQSTRHCVHITARRDCPLNNLTHVRNKHYLY